MSKFMIVQIGEDVEATEGIPEGCDLCGHCKMLGQLLSDGRPLPCGGAVTGAVTMESPTAGRIYSTRWEGRHQPTRPSEQATQGAN